MSTQHTMRSNYYKNLTLFKWGSISNTLLKVLLLLFFLGVGYYLNNVYRPYIYSHNINDFGIADIGTNILFIPLVIIFNDLIYKYRTRRDKQKWILYSFLILTLHELLSYWVPFFGHFDYKDILGLLSGAILTLKIYEFFEE